MLDITDLEKSEIKIRQKAIKDINKNLGPFIDQFIKEGDFPIKNSKRVFKKIGKPMKKMVIDSLNLGMKWLKSD
tara:strand:+ start:6136 stop:6357 length:222 start_codon:yes stop_codon:yes gene_type:complete